MVYLRKDVVDALYNAGLKSNALQDFVNNAVMERLEETEKEKGVQKV